MAVLINLGIASLITFGLLLAGSDGPLFPAPNIAGLFLFIGGGIIAARKYS